MAYVGEELCLFLWCQNCKLGASLQRESTLTLDLAMEMQETIAKVMCLKSARGRSLLQKTV